MLMKKWDRLPPEMRNDAVRSYYDILKKKRLTLICKRLFDIVASLVLLILLSPVFLILAIAIKADSRGPVFSGRSGSHSTTAVSASSSSVQ